MLPLLFCNAILVRVMRNNNFPYFLLGLVISFTPFPRRDKRVSGCVPAGIFILTDPSKVRTSTLPPKIAYTRESRAIMVRIDTAEKYGTCVIDIGILTCISSPSLLKYESDATSTSI